MTRIVNQSQSWSPNEIPTALTNPRNAGGTLRDTKNTDDTGSQTKPGSGAEGLKKPNSFGQ
eukprot:NODE_9914_length_457_cov_3.617647_g8815_i0.p3 GENE.NODE_9914_length_457_cov_3.617647_g8815_i0~~NODE_9914_length_457_cov_3.617647_g8815_i0.p3  ORF type:complete len:61 (+),score=3.52 NODE_9914_length_457_cov_3.617647_g8815_i0:145-327(+)